MLRGDVWLINLDPTLGPEIRKTRPAVIVGDDSIGVLPLKVIVPITEWKERFTIAPWLVLIAPSADNGLDRTSGPTPFRCGRWPGSALSDVWAG
jgi:mRNA interferase MazF